MHKLCDAPGDTEESLRKQLREFAGDDKVYVLGLGNTDRADDGAGILVAEELRKPFPAFSFSEHDGVEGVVLDVSEKEGDAVVVFVDAGQLNLEPGSIRLVPKDAIKETEITTHRVAVALMASVLEKAGKRSAVVCIQPEKIEFRGSVTSPVRRGVEKITSILSEIMKKNNR